ncbi:MAG TPA: hypothetical protein VGH28_00235 [Polyangiaceae bacterium]|jgi:hypothetical protein
MARSVDVLVAFITAHGNRSLGSGARIPWERLRSMFASDATFASGSRPIVAWFEAAKAEHFYVVDGARLVAPAPVKVGAIEVAPRMLHGFVGSSALLFVTRRPGGGYGIHHVVDSFSPRTSLTNADVIAFVEASPESDALKERWLWWDEHNLHWAAERAWPAFVRAAIDRGGAELLQHASTVQSHVDLSDRVRRAWRDLEKARANPDFGPIFAIRDVATSARVPLYTDRAAARAALDTSLEAIASFAEREHLGAWGDYFRAARDALDADAPSDMVRETFGDAGLDGEALRLLDAAWKADAFGGMGSWNDLSPDDRGGYDAVSQALFAALRPAVEAALNAP